MKFTVAKLIVCLTVAMSLLSCTSSYVSIKETMRSPEAPPTTYKKLLVIGFIPSNNLRESFENIFAETLQEHGVAAVTSYTLISDLSKADSNQIQAMARQADADAVIITRVLTKSEHAIYTLATGHVEQRTVAESTTNGNETTTVAMSGVGIVPGEMDTAGATMQTRFFDTASTKLVWSALSHAAGDDNERIDVCWKLSALLTKALSKDHLIQINTKEFHEPKI